MSPDPYFVHINKTGGSSIEHALGIKFQHKTAQELVAEIGSEAWASGLSFSFVRNPWDRVVSHYHWRIKTNQTGLGDSPIPFGEWVTLAYGENDPVYYDKPKMFMPQIHWLTEDMSANAANIAVDFIGRFENFQSDFHTLCRKLSLEIIPELPRLKPSERSAGYAQYYTPQTVDIIAKWFKNDIITFGYRFGD